MSVWNIGEGIEDALCLWHHCMENGLLTTREMCGIEMNALIVLHRIKNFKNSTISWKGLPSYMTELDVILKWSAKQGMSEYRYPHLERKRQKSLALCNMWDEHILIKQAN